MCLVCIITAEEERVQSSTVLCGAVEEAQQRAPSELDMLDEYNTAVYYFAIGSMTNSTALSLRELSVISSQPATLNGFRLLFRGVGGMATVERADNVQLLSGIDEDDYPFDCVHGVLHLISVAQMKQLDYFEGGYNKLSVKINLYDNREVNAFVYQMDATRIKLPNMLPSERYTDIIAQGCLAHGVTKQWIDFIKGHRCIPRKKSLEFSSFSMHGCTSIPIFSSCDVQRNDGKDGLPLWIVINNKVLEFEGDRNSFFPYGYFRKQSIGGTDYTLKFAKGFFEPKYKMSHEMIASSELSAEHRSWIEDNFANPPVALQSSKWVMKGCVNDNRNAFVARKAKIISSLTAQVDLRQDIFCGFSQFFLASEHITAVLLCEGSAVGQEICIRKSLAERDFANNITIKIKHLNLESPNRFCDAYCMSPTCYYVSFVWDGVVWLQVT